MLQHLLTSHRTWPPSLKVKPRCNKNSLTWESAMLMRWKRFNKRTRDWRGGSRLTLPYPEKERQGIVRSPQVPGLLTQWGRKRVQPHPAHLHHHSTNTHHLYPPHKHSSSNTPNHPATTTPVATLPTTHVPPHHFTTTFATLIHHPIPPYPLPSQPPRRCHPFIDTITNTPLLAQWEPFTLDRYTGETDPDEHLKIYITYVTLYTSHDAIFCIVFPTILKGLALEWFM